MKRILIIVGGYLPAKKYGGPVTSICNLVDNLAEEFSFFIVAKDHDLGETERFTDIKDGWNKVGNATVKYVSDKFLGKKLFSEIVTEIKPHLIYLSSVFLWKMNFPALSVAKKHDIPVVLAPRGELSKKALRIKAYKKLPFILFVKLTNKFRNVNFHATSQDEYDAAIRIFRPEKNRVFLYPNMPTLAEKSLQYNSENDKLRLVFISRIHQKKNLLFAIETAVKSSSNIVFDIYGPIEQPDYWEKCLSAINTAPSNVKIEYKGAIAPGESGVVFSKYDFFIFPTFTENYGHVIVEAITSGCGILLSKGTTPFDDIDGCGGYVLPLEEPEKWTETIDELSVQTAERREELKTALKDYVERKFNVEELKNGYKKMFLTSIDCKRK